MQRQSCAQTLNEIHVVAVRQVGIDQCQTKRMVLNHLLGAGERVCVARSSSTSMTGTNLTVTTGSLDGMLDTALLRISRL